MIQQQLTIATSNSKQVIDITDTLQSILETHSITEGFVSVFVKHTTAALTTADLDPGTDQDMLDALEKIIPDLQFKHPHNPKHAPDHIMSSLIGASLTIPIMKGHLILGEWQRIVLVELDGPRSREIVVSVAA